LDTSSRSPLGALTLSVQTGRLLSCGTPSGTFDGGSGAAARDGERK